MPVVILVICLVLMLVTMFIIRRFYLQQNIIKILFMSYLGVLLISAIFYYAFPKPNQSITYPKIDYQGYDELYHRYDIFDESRENIDREKLTSFKKKEEEITFLAKRLKIDVGASENIFIAVEKRADLKDKIIATEYRTPIIIGEYDVSEEIPLSEFTVNEDELTIYQSEASFELVARNHLFPFEMFSKRTSSQGGMSDEIYTGDDVLYLEIPEDVSLEYDETVNMWIEE